MKKLNIVLITLLVLLFVMAALTCDNGNSPDTTILESIAVTTEPKTQYNLDEDFDSSGMVVTATYSDGSTAEVTGYTISGYDKNTLGYQIITVTYDGKTAQFSVKVIDPILPMVETPTALPAGGNYSMAQVVILATSTSGADIYYTINGTVPTSSSEKYVVPININVSTTLRAIAVKSGMNDSDLMTETYTINISLITAFTSLIDAANYLNSYTGENSKDYPLYLPLQIDLGVVTQVDSGWQKLLGIIEAAGKYINLDLSTCTISSTEFFPVSGVEIGKGKIVNLVFPNMVTHILGFNSYFTNLKSFSGTGIINIGSMTFDGCTSLALTILPEGITSIGYSAFRGCTNLALTSLPEGITSIDSSAFEGCTNLALTSLPSGITSIDYRVFYDCRNLALTSLPSGITSIGERAFWGCTNLALTSLPEGITSIGEWAFPSCRNLALTSLPSGLTSIGDHAFESCTNLALTSLPSGLTSIGEMVFFNCTNLALTSLPSGLTSIGAYAFAGCTNLALISLPEGITSIGEGAFSSCVNLALVICHAENPPELDSFVFSPIAGFSIKVPTGCADIYKADTNWSIYAVWISEIE